MMFLCETEITRLSEFVARAKLILPIVLEWRNWQTQQTQNLPPVTRRGGSTPPSSTKFTSEWTAQQIAEAFPWDYSEIRRARTINLLGAGPTK
jgi:hypothetical protein